MQKKDFDENLSLINNGRADRGILKAMLPYKVDNAIIMAAGYNGTMN